MADGSVVIDVDVNGKDVTGLNNQLDQLEGKSAKASRGIGDMVKAMGLVKLGSAAFDVLKGSIEGAVTRFDKLNQFPKVLTAMGASTDDATRATNKLKEGIDGLPTKLQDVSDTTQQMYSVFKDADLAADSTLALNNALLASGSSGEKAQRGTEQYMKILRTGKVELDSYTTLQETMGFGLDKLAEKFGFTGKSAQQDLYKALQSGQITVEQFNQGLIDIQDGLGGTKEVARKTTEGIATSFSNLKNSITNGVANVLTKFDEIVTKVSGKSIAANLNSLKGIVNNTFSAITKAMDGLIPVIEKVTGFVKEHSTAFKILGSIVVATAAGFIAFKATIGIMNSVKSAIMGVKKAFVLMKTAMMANPFALVIAGIVALAAGLIYFYKTSEPFRSKVDNIVAGLKDFMKPINQVFEGIKLLTKGFAEMLINGPSERIAELRSQSIKIFPEELWQGMINFSAKINDMKQGIVAIGKIVSGSIKNITELGDFLEGAFTVKGEQNIMKIGKTIENMIDAFKKLINPTEKAGHSIDIFSVGIKVLKTVILAMLGPVGLIIKGFELLTKTLGGKDVNKGIDTIMSSFKGLVDSIKKYGPQLGTNFGTALEGILGAIANALPGIVSGALQVISGFVAGIVQGLPSIVVSAGELIMAFTNGIVTLLPIIAMSAAQIIKSLTDGILLAMPTIVESATSIITTFSGSLTEALPKVIEAGANLINALLQGITEQLPKLVESMATLIVTWLSELNNHLPDILQAGFELLINFLKGLADNIGNVTDQAISIIVNFVNAIGNRMDNIIGAAVNLMINFLNGLSSRMPDIIDAGVTLIVSVLQGISNNLSRIIDAGTDLVVKCIEGIGNNLYRLVNAAADLVDKLVESIISYSDRMWKAAIRLINGLADGIDNNKEEAREAVRQLVNSLGSAIVGDELWDAGTSLMEGLLKGIKWGFEKVKDFVSGIADIIASLKGPIPYDKKVLIDNGSALMAGLEKGIITGFKNVKHLASNMVDSISKEFSFDSAFSNFNFASPEFALNTNMMGATSLGSRIINNSSNTVKTINNQPLITMSVKWEGKEDIRRTMEEIGWITKIEDQGGLI